MKPISLHLLQFHFCTGALSLSHAISLSQSLSPSSLKSPSISDPKFQSRSALCLTLVSLPLPLNLDFSQPLTPNRSGQRREAAVNAGKKRGGRQRVRALKGGMREKVQIATKFGITHNVGKMDIRGDPEYVRAACEASLKRLDVDCIDLYYVHRIDARVPIEVTMGELKKLIEEGKIKYVGLSEASVSTIRRAHAVHPITAVQNEWSLWSRDLEEELIPTCRELGIGIVPYSPLGRGFLSAGPKLVQNLSDDDFRKIFPRFQTENLETNKMVYERLSEMATRKGCTPSQLALAWVHHQGDDVSPIPGTTKIDNFNENIGALSVKLTPEEMAQLSALVDIVKGDRHAFMGNTWINSNTPPLSSWKADK